MSLDQTSGNGVMPPAALGRWQPSAKGLKYIDDDRTFLDLDYLIDEEAIQVVDTRRIEQSSDFEKLLPDGRGGFWGMGESGRRVARFDSSLDRVDEQGFTERVWRVLSASSGKDKGGFYDRGGWFKKGLFVWVILAAPLFGILLLGGLVAGVGKRRVSEVASVLSLVYLAGAVLALPICFWEMSGRLL